MSAAPNRPSLVLHIGLQKTGTSSIQLMLAGNAAALAGAGYVFPALPGRGGRVWTSPFRHNIVVTPYADFPSAFEPMTPQQAETFWDGLAAGAAVPILSGEEFSRLLDVGPLAAALSRFAVHLVVYLRRQDRFAESLYNQRNKILLSRRDPQLLAPDLLGAEGLARFLQVERFAPLLDFEALVDRFTAALDPVRVSVRNFSREHLEGGDVCRDFATLLDLDPDGLTLPGREANTSVANAKFRRLLEIDRTRGREAALEVMGRLADELERGVDLSGEYALLPATERAEMLGRHRAGNARLAERYGVDLG